MLPSTGSSQSSNPGAAHAHPNVSNRRPKKHEGEIKTVHKSVLDNPFNIKWPASPLNVQNAILARAIELLQGVAEFNLHRFAHGHRKQECQRDAPVPYPDILQHVTVGINEVTKRLESQCKKQRTIFSRQQVSEVDETPKNPSIYLILVCRPDIDPPLLVAHIPHLVAACNSTPNGTHDRVMLVTLPKGAELSLSQALGLRRAAVMAFDKSISKDVTLQQLLESIPLIVAPWLIGMQTDGKKEVDKQKNRQHSQKALIPTHVKQLRTTAPKDMRAAKLQRAKRRAEAKKKSIRQKTKDATSTERQKWIGASND